MGLHHAWYSQRQRNLHALAGLSHRHSISQSCPRSFRCKTLGGLLILCSELDVADPYLSPNILNTLMYDKHHPESMVLVFRQLVNPFFTVMKSASCTALSHESKLCIKFQWLCSLFRSKNKIASFGKCGFPQMGVPQKACFITRKKHEKKTSING